MDFVTRLPLAQNYNTILIIVNRLSKMAHFLPLTFGLDEDPRARSLKIARLLRDRIVVLYGIPSSIVTNRDPRFTSDLTRNLYKIIGIT